MKDRLFLRILLLILLMLTALKCTDEDPSGIVQDKNFNDLSKEKLIINSKKKFSTNESLEFSVNTGSKEGFIYLVYVDKSGETSLLYPNDISNQKKKSGKLKFPDDFGGADIKTTKDCKNCDKEKTTIVVLLSNDPIENIQTMDEEKLLAMNNQTKYKRRSLSTNLINSSIMVKKFDFFVE